MDGQPEVGMRSVSPFVGQLLPIAADDAHLSSGPVMASKPVASTMMSKSYSAAGCAPRSR